MSLDDLGFVIKESRVIKSEDEKKISEISREGNQVTTPNSTTVKWNANPLYLNEEEVSQEEIYKKATNIIRKYPNTQKYYEELLGISFDEALKEDKSN